MLHQQTMDEDISATDAAQEDQVNAVVEEGDESPREDFALGEDKTQNIMLDKSTTAITQPETQSKKQPDTQPDTRSANQPANQPYNQSKNQPVNNKNK